MLLFDKDRTTSDTTWDRVGKRRLEMSLVRVGWPVMLAARAALRHSVRHSDLEFLLTQKRVGAGEGAPEDRLFEIEKWRTVDLDRHPLSALAGIFKVMTLDELAQLENVRRGEMRIFSYRPTLLDPVFPQDTTYEMILDRIPPRLQDPYRAMTQRNPPGLVSTYALRTRGREIHWNNGPEIAPDANEEEMRVELDLFDDRNDSFASNLRLGREYMAMMATMTAKYALTALNRPRE